MNTHPTGMIVDARTRQRERQLLVARELGGFVLALAMALFLATCVTIVYRAYQVPPIEAAE